MAEDVIAYSLYDYPEIRELAHGVKHGNEDSIRCAADMMCGMLKRLPTKDAIIVPMAGQFGMAQYTMDIAQRVADRMGMECIDGLQTEPHKPLYDLKRKQPNRLVHLPHFSLTEGMKKGKAEFLTDNSKHIYVIDNVIDMGITAMAAMKAFGREINLLTLGHTDNHHCLPIRLQRV